MSTNMSNMKPLIFLLLLLFTSLLGNAQANTCGDPVWSDEFNYEGAPDPSKWGYDVGGGGWGNQELQTYTNNRNNSWVADGKLFIKAIKTNGNWSSARLVTRQKGDWTYGRIEIRAKIPAGRGIWSAIWMLPTDFSYGNWPNSGEIDIMEHVGYDVNRIYGTIHTEAFNHTLGTQKGSNTMEPTAYTEFHDYAVEWDAENISIFVDEKRYFTFQNLHKTSAEWPFDKRFHLLLNIAIGGSWGGAQGIDGTITEAVMEIEHVKVYNLAPQQPVIIGTEFVQPNEEVSFECQQVSNASFLWDFPEDVQIIDGQNTNLINVIWGETSGPVKVKLQTPCDTLDANPLNVKLTTELTPLTVQNFTGENTAWKVNETATNTVTLEKVGNDNLRVNFSVQTPTNNPSIEYIFDETQNLSQNSCLVINLKTEKGSAPSNLRIDLIDQNGKSETNNLFKLEPLNDSGNYAEYKHIFGTGTTSGFDIEHIKSIRIYFNYGMFGTSGTGYFEFQPIQLKNKITSTNYLTVFPLQCWPNPATQLLTLDRNYNKVIIFNNQGQQMYEGSGNSIDVSRFQNGIYLISATGERGIYQTKFIKLN